MGAGCDKGPSPTAGKQVGKSISALSFIAGALNGTGGSAKERRHVRGPAGPALPGAGLHTQGGGTDLPPGHGRCAGSGGPVTGVISRRRPRHGATS